MVEAFPKAKVVSYPVTLDSFENSPKYLLGVHSGLAAGPKELAEFAEENSVGLVFDPTHLLRESFTGQARSYPGAPTRSVPAWRRQFRTLSESIEVVDIHPSGRGELDELLSGEGSLVELARVAKEVNVSYLRVEVPLPCKEQFPLALHRANLPVLSEIARVLNEI
jgi:hypothetical protein